MKKCLCKKDYESESFNGFILDFENGKLYEYLVYYHNREDKNYKYYMIYFEGTPASLDKETFNIYFVDVNKNRKMKLQKLNGISAENN